MTASRFPHPLTLLVACILIAGALTWVVPAGEYQRRGDPATGRELVVPGTYARVDAAPVGPFQALVGIPRGMIAAAPVIFFVFLVGGAFAVVERTGALGRLVGSLAAALEGRGLLVIPVAGLTFATGGALIQMQEELIAFVPVLLLLTSRLGFNPVVAVAMSLGASAVGASFSPINPFQVGIAQKVAKLDLLSGWEFRLAFLLPALAIWIAGTMLYARRTRAAAAVLAPVTPTPSEARGKGAISSMAPVPRASRGVGVTGAAGAGVRHAAVLLTVLLAFVAFVVGVLRFHWDFDQLAAVFFVMGVAAGLLGGLRLAGTVEAFVEGLRSMAFAALLIGFARGIYVVLEEGRIVGTIVHALFTPIADLPVTLSALAMLAAHGVVHVPVPSTSGQAVLTLPILVPLSDLIGLSRQVTVLAYQYGAGLCELVTPTNGALMAMLAACGVRYDAWIGFAAPVLGVLVALAVAAIGTAVLVGV